MEKNGTYNVQNKTIKLSEEAVKNFLEDAYFHEITHAVFTRGVDGTGFQVWLYDAPTGQVIGEIGRTLNEGATEYIATKLMEDTKYRNIHNYLANRKVIEHLCIIYSEEFILKALKYGPHILSEQLEKDGVSFNELSEILDEMMLQNGQRSIFLANRALNITKRLLLLKYLNANQNEKMQIVNRAREIHTEQYLEKNKIKQFYTSGMVAFGEEPLRFMVKDKVSVTDSLNEDFYRIYMRNHQFLQNANNDDVLAIQSVVNTAILGTNSISLYDIENIELNKINQNELASLYVVKLKNRTLVTLCAGIDKSGNRVIGKVPENLKIKLTGVQLERKFKVGDLLKEVNRENFER